MNERSVILYIAMSLDGYIAAPGDDLSFLSMVEAAGEDYGYADFIDTVDTVVLGRKTYDWVMKQVTDFPHADKEAYVITRTPRPAVGNTNFYTGDVGKLIRQLKHASGKKIFIDGGAELVQALLKENLIDEYIISVIPVLLGDGIALFSRGLPKIPLALKQVKSYKTGLVQLHYSRA
jgi:dihydrofolate reductase